MEGRVEEPQAVQSAAEIIALCSREQTAGSEVCLPLLERVHLLVLLRYSGGRNDLLDQGVGDGYFAADMGGLRWVLGQDLDDVV